MTTANQCQSSSSVELAAVSDRYSEQIGKAFLANVLVPYRDHCKYLKQAEFTSDLDEGVKGYQMHGQFGIEDSCYIDDTGHFNAVEFNICYNQLAYLHLGHCIKHRLIPELYEFDHASFQKMQLSHFLIASITSSYGAEINARKFKGKFGINSIRRRSGCTFIKTFCDFTDDENGRSKGEVTLAVLAP
jgi:hypothetical protein